MSRHENENLAGLDIPGPTEYDIIAYGPSGETGVDEKSVCARQVTNKETGNVRYFVKYGDSRLFSPHRITKREEKMTRWKMKRVSKEVFDLYVRFLKSGSNVLLNNAERMI